MSIFISIASHHILQKDICVITKENRKSLSLAHIIIYSSTDEHVTKLQIILVCRIPREMLATHSLNDTLQHSLVCPLKSVLLELLIILIHVRMSHTETLVLFNRSLAPSTA